jgi:hypothetical protein
VVDVLGRDGEYPFFPVGAFAGQGTFAGQSVLGTHRSGNEGSGENQHQSHKYLFV